MSARIAIMTAKPGWHGRRLARAFAALGVATRFVSLADCRVDLEANRYGIVVPGFRDGLPDGVFVREIAAGRSPRRVRERRREQHDTEIGVRADRLVRRDDRPADPFAHGARRSRDRRGRRFSAADEVHRLHAMTAGMETDVAGLQGRDIERTRVDERPFEVRAHDARASLAAASRRCAKSCASRAAMSIDATDCRPCQAGMPFTSMTTGAPSRARMRSTPA